MIHQAASRPTRAEEVANSPTPSSAGRRRLPSGAWSADPDLDVKRFRRTGNGATLITQYIMLDRLAS